VRVQVVVSLALKSTQTALVPGFFTALVFQVPQDGSPVFVVLGAARADKPTPDFGVI
jgi:hypothetical protein